MAIKPLDHSLPSPLPTKNTSPGREWALLMTVPFLSLKEQFRCCYVSKLIFQKVFPYMLTQRPSSLMEEQEDGEGAYDGELACFLHIKLSECHCREPLARRLGRPDLRALAEKILVDHVKRGSKNQVTIYSVHPGGALGELCMLSHFVMNHITAHFILSDPLYISPKGQEVTKSFYKLAHLISPNSKIEIRHKQLPLDRFENVDLFISFDPGLNPHYQINEEALRKLSHSVSYLFTRCISTDKDPHVFLTFRSFPGQNKQPIDEFEYVAHAPKFENT